MVGMTVELIEDKKTWDEFVDESPYAVLSHKWDFLKIIEKYSGYKLYTYGVYKGDYLLGIYPLFYKRKLGLRTIYSPPMGALYLGFLVSGEYDKLKQSKKESFLNSFLGEMENEIKMYAPDYTLIHTTPNFLDIRFLKWDGYLVIPEYTYALDLNGNAEEIWNGFSHDLRKDLRQADRHGLEFRASDDISILYERQEKRYRELGANFSMNREYLNELTKAFPDNIRVYYAYNNEGEVISASCQQEYKRRVLGWAAMARTVENGNEFLLWKLIELANSEGYEKFEISGANARNQCIFKSKFNPSLELFYKIIKKSLFGKTASWAYSNLYLKHRPAHFALTLPSIIFFSVMTELL